VRIDAVPRLTPWADICRPFGTRFGGEHFFKIVAARGDSANQQCRPAANPPDVRQGFRRAGFSPRTPGRKRRGPLPRDAEIAGGGRGPGLGAGPFPTRPRWSLLRGHPRPRSHPAAEVSKGIPAAKKITQIRPSPFVHTNVTAPNLRMVHSSQIACSKRPGLGNNLGSRTRLASGALARGQLDGFRAVGTLLGWFGLRLHAFPHRPCNVLLVCHGFLQMMPLCSC